jgi:tRNA(fMet)-specific endonuclease VapC
MVDTDILSLFLRGDPKVAARFAEYLTEHQKINLSIITYYEIVSGLKHRDARKQLKVFLEFLERNTIVALSTESVNLAADQYAAARKRGQPIDDIDLLIAGIALANNLVLVTRNREHFKRITGLELADWTR